MHRLYLLILVLLVQPVCAQENPVIDSLKSQAFRFERSEDSSFVKACFGVADYYMELDQYDSAQLWLNRIMVRLPLKKPSLFSYFLTTRQAEVYYYNNLQELGLQESYRALALAKQLNDSLLLADAHNFLGLFSMNQDSLSRALHFFRAALAYVKRPPYPASYLSLTMPHHIYGNLAEAQIKRRSYDSAMQAAFIALVEARLAFSQRGEAVAMVTLGEIHHNRKQSDSAIFYYREARRIAEAGGDVDVALFSLGSLARHEQEAGNRAAANEALEAGFLLLKSTPQLNQFFTLQFLEMAVEIYRAWKDFYRLSEALTFRSELEERHMERSNAQLQSILAAGLKNETRLLSLEVAEARQQQKLTAIRFWLALLVIGVLLVLSYIIWYRSRQRLRLSQVRSKISQDLHDDVGATLTSISLLSEVARQQQDPGERNQVLDRIGLYSRNLINDMSDIVWVINPGNDAFSRITDRMKNFGQPLLASAGMDLHFSADPGLDTITLSMVQRKNLYLIFKEALHNAVKHSGGSEVRISLQREPGWLEMRVADNGRCAGQSSGTNGNGLQNMQRRSRECLGEWNFQSEPGAGTVVRFRMPLTLNA